MDVRVDTEYGETQVRLGPVFKRVVTETVNELCETLHVIQAPIEQARLKVEELRDVVEHEASKLASRIKELEHVPAPTLEDQATHAGLEAMLAGLRAILEHFRPEEVLGSVDALENIVGGLETITDRAE